jgi:hypothetical protein
VLPLFSAALITIERFNIERKVFGPTFLYCLLAVFYLKELQVEQETNRFLGERALLERIAYPRKVASQVFS